MSHLELCTSWAAALSPEHPECLELNQIVAVGFHPQQRAALISLSLTQQFSILYNYFKFEFTIFDTDKTFIGKEVSQDK